MQRYLRIVTMDGRLEPLTCNIAQLKVHNTLELQRQRGLPQRIIVLKARREGVSTYTEGRFFYEINARPMRYACVCSADLDSTNKVFKMGKTFQDNMPDGVRRATEYSNRKEIVYASPHMSALVAQTAGKGVLGRGGLTHCFHATEFAFWENAKEQFGGAAQEVPDAEDTIVVIESTANGVGGAFYDMYMQAYDDYTKSQNLKNYLPVFLPWYIFPAYRMEGHLEIGRPHDDGFDAEWLDAEPELVERFGCSPDQLMWRRWAIKNKCQGDLSLFRQEYPSAIHEAFQSTGRPVFSHAFLDRQDRLSVGGQYGVFRDGQLQSCLNAYNSWTVFKPPHPSHQYAMGVDTMVGRLSDKADIKSERDSHGVVVLDRDTKEVVAVYRGDCIQDELASQCYACGKLYHTAYIAPELPNGMQVLVRLREMGYPNLFMRPDSEDTEVVDETDRLGWKTTTSTRPVMVEAFKSFIQEDGVRLNSRVLIQEMREFIYDKTGKPIHAAGKHDDMIFAAMIALQVHLHSPFNAIPYQYDTVGEGFVAVKPKDLARAGVIDPGPWHIEEEDELWLSTD